MRLDKYLCQSTGLTRSQAKRALHSGRVLLNGNKHKDSSYKLQASDQITLDGDRLGLVGQRYLMLHKPAGVECSHNPSHHPSVFSLLELPRLHDLHCAGRLDQDTTGLVLITDDGQWSHRISAPKKDQFKGYSLQLAEPLTQAQADQLRQGVLLNGETKPTLAARLQFVDDMQVDLWIQEGRYHQVKRMLAAVGNRVVALHRASVGDLTLGPDLAPGQWRWLTEAEIKAF